MLKVIEILAIYNYNITILFFKGNLWRGEVGLMTSYDLIWLLIELLLKDKDNNSKADNKEQD